MRTLYLFIILKWLFYGGLLALRHLQPWSGFLRLWVLTCKLCEGTGGHALRLHETKWRVYSWIRTTWWSDCIQSFRWDFLLFVAEEKFVKHIHFSHIFVHSLGIFFLGLVHLLLDIGDILLKLSDFVLNRLIFTNLRIKFSFVQIDVNFWLFREKSFQLLIPDIFLTLQLMLRINTYLYRFELHFVLDHHLVALRLFHELMQQYFLILRWNVVRLHLMRLFLFRTFQISDLTLVAFNSALSQELFWLVSMIALVYFLHFDLHLLVWDRRLNLLRVQVNLLYLQIVQKNRFRGGLFLLSCQSKRGKGFLFIAYCFDSNLIVHFRVELLVFESLHFVIARWNRWIYFVKAINLDLSIWWG